MTGDGNAFALHEVELAGWQRDACAAWQHGDDPSGPTRGTLEIFTGGGKSLIALECLRRAAHDTPALRALVVVPTLALARQWRQVFLANTDLGEADIGRRDGLGKDDLNNSRVPDRSPEQRGRTPTALGWRNARNPHGCCCSTTASPRRRDCATGSPRRSRSSASAADPSVDVTCEDRSGDACEAAGSAARRRRAQAGCAAVRPERRSLDLKPAAHLDDQHTATGGAAGCKWHSGGGEPTRSSVFDARVRPRGGCAARKMPARSRRDFATPV